MVFLWLPLAISDNFFNLLVFMMALRTEISGLVFKSNLLGAKTRQFILSPQLLLCLPLFFMSNLGQLSL